MKSHRLHTIRRVEPPEDGPDADEIRWLEQQARDAEKRRQTLRAQGVYPTDVFDDMDRDLLLQALPAGAEVKVHSKHVLMARGFDVDSVSLDPFRYETKVKDGVLWVRLREEYTSLPFPGYHGNPPF